MPDETVAALSDVTRTYGGVPVLDSVSLTVEPGLTAVIGPNGSGKSTLLECSSARRRRQRVRSATPARPGRSRSGTSRSGCHSARVHGPRDARVLRAPRRRDDPDAALDRVGARRRRRSARRGALGGMRRLLGIAQAVPATPRSWSRRAGERSRPGMRERAFRAAADQADGDTAVVVSHALDLVDDTTPTASWSSVAGRSPPKDPRPAARRARRRQRE